MNQVKKKTTASGFLSNTTSRPLYQGAGKQEEQDQKSQLMQVQHQILLVERRVVGSIPREVFRLQYCDNEEFILVPILCLLRPIIVNCGRITLIVIMCNVAACSD